MSALLRDVGKRIKLARGELSQEYVAARLGVSQSAIATYENGTRAIELEKLFALSRVLGRPVEYFLGLDTGNAPDEDELLALYKDMPAQARRIALGAVRSIRDSVGEGSEK